MFRDTISVQQATLHSDGNYRISSNKRPPPIISAHPQGHDVKQAFHSISTERPSPPSLTFLNSRNTMKICFCCHFIYKFLASITEESVQENSFFAVKSLPVISISMCLQSYPLF